MRAGDVVADRFELAELRGGGGMGLVFRAIDRRSGTPVALKLLRETGSPARFVHEAELLARLSHPAIVRYVDHGRTEDGAFYLAMEWLDGEDLSETLRRGPLAPRDALTLVTRIVAGLAVAHAHGAMHRDIKPANVFLPACRPEQAKLLDFGLARLWDGARGLTRTGALLGTPGYMSPEQARGERDLTERTDVFAVGCVLFECLAGRPAFEGSHPVAIISKVLLGPAPRLRDVAPSVPPALDALVARALSPSPEGRPAHGAALLEELERLALDPAPPAPGAARTLPSLGGEERAVSTIVMVSPGSPLGGELAAHAERIAGEHGGRFQRLVDTSVVVAFEGSTSPADQAEHAARCALTLRAAADEGRIVVASGEVTLGGALDRAAGMAASTEGAPGVRLDALTARLLRARFEVEPDGDVFVLRDARGHDASPRLRPRGAPFVGRDRELATLAALFDECVAEPCARGALLTGGPGVGKSRLARTALERFRAADARLEVWTSSASTIGAAPAYAVIAALVRDVVQQDAATPGEAGSWALRARIGRLLPTHDVDRVAGLLAEAADLSRDAGPAAGEAGRREGAQFADGVRRAFAEWVGAECRARPLVLHVEDLHAADAPSLAVLEAALEAHAEAPLFLLGTARPDLVEARPRLFADAGVQEIRLGDLRRRDCERLAAALLGEEDPAAVARVVARAAGNPFFLEELIRVEIDREGATLDGSTSGALPESVLSVVQSRLRAIEPRARRAMRAASVLGASFTPEGVEALLGGDEPPAIVRAHLATLVEHEVVALGPHGTYTFAHALLRDAAYAMLTPEDLARGHRLAAEWLAAGQRADPVVIASHHELAGEPERAVPWLDRAAERSLRRGDFAGVVRQMERAIAGGAQGEALGAVQALGAEALRVAGDLATAEKLGSAALALLPASSPRWFLASRAAMAGSVTRLWSTSGS